ncbi:hypothetical protein ACEOH9_10250 [Pseudomonas aeruginosa]
MHSYDLQDLYRQPLRRTPVVLSGLIDDYRCELGCSRKAAAWELREVFAEVAAQREKAEQSPLLGLRVCWVGSVGAPTKVRRQWDVTFPQLVAYFDKNMRATDGPVEFIEDAPQSGEPHLVSDAAVAFNADGLAGIFYQTGREIPGFLWHDPVRDDNDMPKGRRKGVTRTLVHGLMEIAANAARKDRDSEFCKKTGRLDPEAPAGTSARLLRVLAKELELEEFPGDKSIKNIL